jgi:c-di-GMP-binding flagellar brake protein YcgR
MSNEEQQQAERRRWARYTLDVPIKVRVRSSSGISSYCYGRGNDISQGGMSIHIPHELSIGQTISLILTLPYSERNIECDAVVRSRDSYRYGVEYVKLSAMDEALIGRVCNALGILQSE